MRRKHSLFAPLLALSCALFLAGCQIAEPSRAERGYQPTPVRSSGDTGTAVTPADVGSASPEMVADTLDTELREVIFESDQVRVIKTLVSTGPVGGEVVIQIRVEVRAPVDAVHITENLPGGVSFISADPSGVIDGASVRWSFEQLVTGDLRTIEIRLRPTSEGEKEACTVVSVDNGLCLPFFAGEARLAVEKTGPTSVELGREATWTVSVTNNGSAPATNVVVTDKLPETFEATSPLRHELGTIEPGDTKTSQFTARAIAQGEFSNQAIVSHDGDPDGSATGATTMSEPITVTQSGIEAALSGPEQAYVFKPESFPITVRNTGDTALRNVRVTQLLPDYVSVIDNGNGRVSGSAIGWMIPELPAGASQSINTELTSTRKGPTTITTTVTADNGVESSDSVTTDWLAVPGVTISISDSKDPIRVNEQTVYEIRVRNQGDFEPVSGSVEVRFTETLRPVSVAGDAQGTISGGTVTFPRTTLEPGKDIDLTITAEGARIGPGRVVLRFSADFLDQPILSEESTNVY